MQRAVVSTKQATPAAGSTAWSPLRNNRGTQVLQRKCACDGNAGFDGECEDCKKKRLQRKLSIGASNNTPEREADRVADQVMSMPAHSAVHAPPHIQRFIGQATEDAGIAPASVDRVLANPGRPLDATLRQDMESRFGHDFSRVRVRAGTAAEQSAEDVNAHAYTVGTDIVFGSGQFTPETSAGRRLIAHELTHVVQQSGIGQGSEYRGPSSNVQPPVQSPQMMMIQRQTKSSKCTDAEVTRLNQAMHVDCNKPRSCSLQGDSCATATAKVAAGNGCVRARTELQQKCFSPGDPGYEEHMRRIALESAALRNCIVVMGIKCALEAEAARAAARAAAEASEATEAAEAAAAAPEAAEGGLTLIEVLEGLGLVLAL
jgi:Domain of unknown function (DUF4157)/Novel toxin 16